MTADDILTMVLRQQAVEAARGRGQFLQLEDCGSPPFRAEVRARDEFGSTIALSQGAGSTEADALRALLRDMGKEPVEWPSEFRISEYRLILERQGIVEGARTVAQLRHGVLGLLAALGIGGES